MRGTFLDSQKIKGKYRHMKLTDSQIRGTAYAGKIEKLRDGNGLYLHVMPSGKYWRYDYRYAGKRRTLSMGVYPAVTLKTARIALFDAKGKLEQGIDPSHEKKIAKYVNSDYSFRAVSTEWLLRHDCTDRSRKDISQRFDKDAYPIIGHLPVDRIRPMDVLAVLRRIESRGADETARRVCTHISQAMRYAVYTGLISHDPCRDLKGALKRKKSTKRYPAITTAEEFGKLLADIDTYSLNLVIALAIKIAPHVALRPSELVSGKWDEIVWQDRQWHIPSERMKKDRPHIVPLSTQVIGLLKQLQAITNRHEFMFPSPVTRGKPISPNTPRTALNRLGYSGVHCPHGFRSTFSTMANESGRFSSDAIESQLSHIDKSRVRAAYNRSEYMAERERMMQWWSDQVDAMRKL